MEVMSQIVSIHEERNPLPTGAGDAPMIKGVKVLGVESKNGRKYPVEVMRKALEKYDGAMVNIDHPKGDEPRSYEDRFGRLVNPRLEADGIYADLSYNPKHPLAEGFAWWAANDPSAVGLSHNAQARTKLNREGVEEIEEIVEVTSVDLVAEPATTAGLMECVMRAKRVSERCWDGYEPTPGKEPYSKGSCKKEEEEMIESKKIQQMTIDELQKKKKDLEQEESKLYKDLEKWSDGKKISLVSLITKHRNNPVVKKILDNQQEMLFVNQEIDKRKKSDLAMKEEDKVIPKPKVRVEADGVDAKIAQLKAASKGLPTRGGHNIDAARKAAASMLKDPELIPKVANAGINFFSDVAKSLSKLGDKSPFHPSYKESNDMKKEAQTTSLPTSPEFQKWKSTLDKAASRYGKSLNIPTSGSMHNPNILRAYIGPHFVGAFTVSRNSGQFNRFADKDLDTKIWGKESVNYQKESDDMEPELFPAEKENDEGNGYEDSLKDQIGDIIMDDELHAEEKVAKLLALITGGQEEPEEAPVAEAEGDAEDEEPKEEQDEEEDKPKNTEESLRRKPSPAVARLLEEVDAYRARDRREKAVTEARKFCSDASLPTYAITESFLGILADVDKKQWKTLVEDRRRVIFRGEKPISSVPADGKLTVDSLVKALRS